MRFFRHSYTLTGVEATGTSTAAKLLFETLKCAPYRMLSGGATMREFAASLGMTIREFAEHNRQHPELGYDKKCDQWLNILGSQDYVIAEGRLPHIFIPKAFHVLFVCDEDIRVARRAQQDHRESELVREDLRRRETADNDRYTMLYGAHVLWKPGQYHLVVNSAMLSPRDIVTEILNKHAEWRNYHLPADQFETDLEAADARIAFA